MEQYLTDNKLIASLALIIIIFLVRGVIVWHLSKQPLNEDGLPRRWINSVKNAANLLVVIGLIVIWLSELRFMALSIAAFAVALVVATREYIQCILGSFYQASNRTFVVGDWIKVGDKCGEVVRSDWFSTILLEVDLESMTYGYTGKTVIIPNNQFINAATINLNFMRRYVSHSFSIVRDAESVNILGAKELLLSKAQEYCQPFQDVAHRYAGLIEKRLGIPLNVNEATVRFSTTNIGKNMVTISFFCPTHEAANIEQRLIDDFMAFWYEELKKVKNSPKVQ